MEKEVIEDDELKKLNDELCKERSALLRREEELNGNTTSDIEKIEEYERITRKFDKLEDIVQKTTISRIFNEGEEFKRFENLKNIIYVNAMRIQVNYLKIIIKEHEGKMKKQGSILREHDKNILNMMGIFLAIFSLIGINVSFFASTFSNSSGKPIEVCEFLKYLLGVNIILVLAIITIFQLIRHYTKK